MKFACGVVIYKPSEDNINYLKKISRIFDGFLVYNNSIGVGDELKEVADQYYKYNRNDGLAKPYNTFIDYCYENQIQVLCLLDQDSKITDEQITYIKRLINDNWNDDYIVYAPRLIGTKKSEWVINSNSFLNVGMLKKCKIKYDEYYFLDRLDVDICTQIKKKGKKILIFEDVVVEHRIGTGKFNEHSPIRHYYISRNRNYYNRKYMSSIYLFFLKTVLQDIRHLLQIIIFESHKRNKIKAFIRGKKSYFNERKLNEKI